MSKEAPGITEEEERQMTSMYREFFTLNKLKDQIKEDYDKSKEAIITFFSKLREKYNYDFKQFGSPEKFQLICSYIALIDNKEYMRKSVKQDIDLYDYVLQYRDSYTKSYVNKDGTETLKTFSKYFELSPEGLEILIDNIEEELSVILNKIDITLNELANILKRDPEKSKGSETRRINKELKKIKRDLEEIDKKEDTNYAKKFPTFLHLKERVNQMLQYSWEYDEKTNKYKLIKPLESLFFSKSEVQETVYIKK